MTAHLTAGMRRLCFYMHYGGRDASMARGGGGVSPPAAG
jgi:hypothetical protein